MVNSMTKQALISPLEPISYVSEWTPPPNSKPIETYVGYRVAQIVPTGEEFPVADPYFWTSCDDVVNAEQYYYDPVTQQINKTPDPAPRPVAQP